jgi:hypothetical protein
MCSMNAEPAPARGHMPFEGHRTCADWRPSFADFVTGRDRLIVLLSRSGHTCPEIAEAMNLTRHGVEHALIRNGVARRRRGTPGIGPVDVHARREQPAKAMLDAIYGAEG